MKIEHNAVVTIKDTEDASLFLKILTPHDERSADAEIFALYVSQKSWGAEMPSAMKHPSQDVEIAIGTPEQKETITDLLRRGAEDDWYPASLVHWDAYRKVRGSELHQIAIMGTICRDDDFHEWVFAISHREILGVRGGHTLTVHWWGELRLKKLPVLLVKIPHKKT